MVSNVREHIAQIGLRIETIHLRRADQAVHSGGTLASTVCTQKQKILASEAATPQRILSDVVINLCHAVIAVLGQRLPLVKHVVNGLGHFGLRR